MGKITVVYNNIQNDKRLRTGWGSSILVEQDKETVLFDTGPDAEDLFFNLDELGINRKNIRKIALSHSHPDHTGALEQILRENPKTVELYMPQQLSTRMSKGLKTLAKNAYTTERKEEIANRIYLLTIKGLFAEEAVLVIDSPRGLIVLVGCAHPRIYRICKTIKTDFGKDLYAVMGGFHFEYYPTFFVKILSRLLKRLDIEIIGPNHCVGRHAIKILQQIFKDGFLDFGNGAIFEFDN